MNASHSVQFNDQGLACFDINTDFITNIQTVEKDRSRQEGSITVFLTEAIVLFKNTRIEYRREDITLTNVMTEFDLQLVFLGDEINRFQ